MTCYLAYDDFTIVGLSWEEARKQCPPGVVPACHNSEDTVTVSGPTELVSQFVKELKEKQIFAKEVNSSGVAFHSKYMETTAPILKKALLNVSFIRFGILYEQSILKNNKSVLNFL